MSNSGQVEDNIGRRLGEYYEDYAGQNQYANKKGYNIRGIEAELYYDSPRIFANFNFSIMTSKYNGTPRDPNGPDVPVNEVPPAEVNMGIGYKLHEYNMRFGWQGKYVHKTGSTAEDIDPDAHFYTLYKPTSSYPGYFIKQQAVHSILTFLWGLLFYHSVTKGLQAPTTPI
ncbi:TonB-dependent receptor [Endozoicomonas sp. Mp262]|uniref:TonB-dependent receptor n=1 Tax=Endozoicomonas sp. Mp262 TaxID=2919499 RepID=UPI0021D84E35